METLKFISGMLNCHLPGLSSLVISERKSKEVGMRRVFYAGIDCQMDLWDGADFRLKPHNHRQDITITGLFGTARNVIVKTGYGPHRLWCYRFTSGLLEGDFKLERMHHEDAQVYQTVPITENPQRLFWSTVHTVEAEPRSAWLVEEGAPAPENTSRLWSVNHNLTLSSKGLYEPMDEPTLRMFENLVNTRLEKETR